MSNAAEEHINRILSQKIKKYTENDTERNLLQAYNLDKQFSADYHGRELFELLQNVDDAYEEYCQKHESARGKEVKTLIEYKNNILRICNTGTTFRKDTIERLCQGAVSDKGEKYIGNKGIGFRSVLNWANVIRIYSGDYSIEFSKQFADIQLEKIKTNNIVQQQIKEKPELCFPILSAPRWIKKKKNLYDTVIEIELLDNATDENDKWNIIHQIEEFDSNILLFLPNITEIIFMLEDTQYSYAKFREPDKNIISIVLTKDNSKRDYYCFISDDIEVFTSRTEKSILKMGIAIPVDKEELDVPLFTYFPIANTESPFNALLHATFRLSENRDSIRKENVNEIVFKELLKFYVTKVTDFFCNKEFGNRSLELLCPKDFNPKYQYYFDSPFYSEDISNYFINLCKEKAKFFNVNKKYIKTFDNPKILDTDYPSFFKGSIFQDLLSPIDECESFAKLLIEDTDFKEEDLCERINNLSDKLSVSQRVEAFLWWIKNYRNCDLLPKLLKDNSKNQNWILVNDTCFFSGAISKIPAWATIKFLNEEYEKEIIKYCSKYENLESVRLNENDNAKRLTIRFLKENSPVDFREYTVENIIKPLNDVIENDYQRSIEFVRFLYNNFDAIKKAESIKEISLCFPANDKNVSESRNLFFGIEYGNTFPEKIMKLAGYKKISSPDLLGLQKSKGVKDFLSWFGVVEYPRIDENCILYTEYTNPETNRYVIEGDYNYVSYLKQKYFVADIEEIKGKSIRNIHEILSKLNEKEIVDWLINDNKLKEEISKVSDSYQFRGRHQKNSRITDNVYPFLPYLNYVFSFSKWIAINKNKYAPVECLFSEDSLLAKYTPCISEIWINKNRGKMTFLNFKDLLQKLGVKSKITDLDSESFYSLLLRLQEDDRSYKFSQTIYRNVISESKKYESSESRYSFLYNKSGKVWTKNNCGYQPISEVFFTSSPVVNIENKYLIDVPFGIDCQDIVKEIFGVGQYEEQYNIDYSSIVFSDLNNDFQKKFKDYLPYVFCYRKDSADEYEKNIFKNVKIYLVNTIALVSKKSPQYVSRSYTPLQDSKNEYTWYIYIDKKIDKYDKNILSKIIQQIFEKIFNLDDENTSARYGELFAVDQERKDFLIEQDFLNLDILKESRKFFNYEKSDKEIVYEYLRKQRKLTNNTEDTLRNLSFLSFTTIQEQKELFDFLQKIHIDVLDLRKILKRSDISVREYNLSRCENLFTKNKQKVKSFLFEQLKIRSIEERKSFLQRILEYEHFPQNNYKKIKDTVSFNPEDIYNKAVLNLLEIENNANKIIDVENIYKMNLGKFRENHKEDSEKVNDFISSLEIKSLLYFELDDVEMEYYEWNKKRINTTYNSISTNSYSKSFVVEALIPCKEIKKDTIINKHHPAAQPQTIKERMDFEIRNQEQGDSAEKLVYYALKENNRDLSIGLGINLGDYDIVWCSEAASRKENLNGQDGLGYDIELIHKKTGERLYIEVKSSQGSACEFEISKNEFNFAENHPDNYVVIFVGNIINKKGSFQILPKRFWENNELFQIEPEKYRIRFLPH